jgi:3-ketosteroid 9alpha-monooxygenase subunit B
VDPGADPVVVTDHDAVLRQHGYHTIRVKGVVQETADTRSFVLDVPDELGDAFRYRPGQFCTFRVRVGGEEHTRCYSMSSAADTGDDLTVTVKRVPGGVVSNWLNDHVSDGDLLEVTRPSGTFCVPPGERLVIGFCGGSGVTPVMSITKSVLGASSRSVRLLYANPDAASVIFDEPLAALRRRHPERFELRHHLDSDAGFLDQAAIVAFVDGRTDADFFICGPGPFMDLVEATLLDLGVDPSAIFIERFVTAGQSESAPDGVADDGAAAGASEIPGSVPGSADVPETIVLILKGKKHTIAYHAGDTVLETARRASLQAPYSCEAGSCATCMAMLKEGTVAMRANEALTEDEVDEGWVLTCQSVPTSPALTIEYEPL